MFQTLMNIFKPTQKTALLQHGYLPETQHAMERHFLAQQMLDYATDTEHLDMAIYDHYASEKILDIAFKLEKRLKRSA